MFEMEKKFLHEGDKLMKDRGYDLRSLHRWHTDRTSMQTTSGVDFSSCCYWLTGEGHVKQHGKRSDYARRALNKRCSADK